MASTLSPSFFGSTPVDAESKKQLQLRQLESFSDNLQQAIEKGNIDAIRTNSSTLIAQLNRLMDGGALAAKLPIIYKLIDYYFTIGMEKEALQLLHVELPKLCATLPKLEFLHYLQNSGDLQLKYNKLAEVGLHRGALFAYKEGINLASQLLAQQPESEATSPFGSARELQELKQQFSERLTAVETAMEVNFLHQGLETLDANLNFTQLHRYLHNLQKSQIFYRMNAPQQIGLCEHCQALLQKALENEEGRLTDKLRRVSQNPEEFSKLFLQIKEIVFWLQPLTSLCANLLISQVVECAQTKYPAICDEALAISAELQIPHAATPPAAASPPLWQTLQKDMAASAYSIKRYKIILGVVICEGAERCNLSDEEDFCALGLGMLASGIATPHTDLSYAILTRENAQEMLPRYTQLSHWVQFRLAFLDETTLKITHSLVYFDSRNQIHLIATENQSRELTSDPEATSRQQTYIGGNPQCQAYYEALQKYLRDMYAGAITVGTKLAAIASDTTGTGITFLGKALGLIPIIGEFFSVGTVVANTTRDFHRVQQLKIFTNVAVNSHAAEILFENIARILTMARAESGAIQDAIREAQKAGLSADLQATTEEALKAAAAREYYTPGAKLAKKDGKQLIELIIASKIAQGNILTAVDIAAKLVSPKKITQALGHLTMVADGALPAIPGLIHINLSHKNNSLYKAISLYLGIKKSELRQQIDERRRSYVEGVDASRSRTKLPMLESARRYICSIHTEQLFAEELELSILMHLFNRPIVILGLDGTIKNRAEVLEYIESSKGASEPIDDPIFIYNDGLQYTGLALAEEYRARGKEVLESLLHIETKTSEEAKEIDDEALLEEHADFYAFSRATKLAGSERLFFHYQEFLRTHLRSHATNWLTLHRRAAHEHSFLQQLIHITLDLAAFFDISETEITAVLEKLSHNLNANFVTDLKEAINLSQTSADPDAFSNINQFILEPFYQSLDYLLSLETIPPDFDPLLWAVNQRIERLTTETGRGTVLENLTFIASALLRRQASPELHLDYYEKKIPKALWIDYLTCMEQVLNKSDPAQVTIYEQLVQCPDPSGFRAIMVLKERKWHSALRKLFQNESEEIAATSPVTVMLHNLSNNPEDGTIIVCAYHLKPEVYKQLFDADGNLLRKPDGVYGRHQVLPIIIDGCKFWVKFYPEQPGSEELVKQLGARLGSAELLPSSSLARLQIGDQSIPILITEDIHTTASIALEEPVLTLNEALQANPRCTESLDLENFTRHLLRVVPTDPEDDDGRDYFYINGKLYRIDNERAFFPAEEISGRWRKHKTLIIKTMLYCLDQMNTPLSRAVLEDFLSLLPSLLVRETLRSCCRVAEYYNSLFTLDEMKIHLLAHGEDRGPDTSSLLAFAIKNDLEINLCNILNAIMDVAREHNDCEQTPTGLQLLRVTKPVLVRHYEKVFEMPGNPKERLDLITQDQWTAPQVHVGSAARPAHPERTSRMSAAVARSMSLRLETFDDTGILTLAFNGIGYCPRVALAKLDAIANMPTEKIISLLLLGNQAGLQAFSYIPDYEQQKRIFSAVSERLAEASPAARIMLLRAATMITTSNLNLSFYRDVLTDSLFIAIIRHTGEKLVYLDLSGTRLTNSALKKMRQYCPNLQRLVLKDMPKVTTIPRLEALPLIQLQIDGTNLQGYPLAIARQAYQIQNWNMVLLCYQAAESAVDPSDEILRFEVCFLQALTMLQLGMFEKAQQKLIQAMPKLAELPAVRCIANLQSMPREAGLELFRTLQEMWENYCAVLKMKQKIYTTISQPKYSHLRPTSTLFNVYGNSDVLTYITPKTIYILTNELDDDGIDKDAITNALKNLAPTIPEIISILITKLSDPNEHIRSHAIQILEIFALPMPEMISVFIDKSTDPCGAVRMHAIQALINSGQTTLGIISAFIDRLTDSNITIQDTAATTLFKLDKISSELISKLLSKLADANEFIKRAIIRILSKIDQLTPEVFSVLLDLSMHRKSLNIQISATESLGKLCNTPPEIVFALTCLLKYSNENVQATTVEIFLKLKSTTPDMITLLAELLTNKNKHARVCAAEALIKLGQATSDVISTLSILINSPTEPGEGRGDFRVEAAKILATLGKTTLDMASNLLKQLSTYDLFYASNTIDILGELKQATPEIISAILCTRQKAKYELSPSLESEVCLSVVNALGKLELTTPEAILTILTIIYERFNQPQATTHALIKLNKMISPKIISAMFMQLASSEAHTVVLIGELIELGRATPQMISMLIGYLKNTDFNIRIRAIKTLGRLDQTIPEVILSIIDCTTDTTHKVFSDSTPVRDIAVQTLIKLGKAMPEVIAILIAQFSTTKPFIRLSIAYILKELNHITTEIIHILIDQLTDLKPVVRFATAETLVILGYAIPKVISTLLALFESHDFSIQSAVAKILGKLDQATPAVISALLAQSKISSNRDVRSAATIALGVLGQVTPETISALLMRTKDPDHSVQYNAVNALNALCKRIDYPFGYFYKFLKRTLTNFAQQFAPMLAEACADAAPRASAPVSAFFAEAALAEATPTTRLLTDAAEPAPPSEGAFESKAATPPAAFETDDENTTPCVPAGSVVVATV